MCLMKNRPHLKFKPQFANAWKESRIVLVERPRARRTHAVCSLPPSGLWQRVPQSYSLPSSSSNQTIPALLETRRQLSLRRYRPEHVAILHVRRCRQKRRKLRKTLAKVQGIQKRVQRTQEAKNLLKM